jgi:hypothetical protein
MDGGADVTATPQLAMDSLLGGPMAIVGSDRLVGRS